MNHYAHMKTRYVDLSHTIRHGTITYPGLPSPVITDFLSREDSKTNYAAGTEFHIGRIDMVANSGTYLDTPFHRYPEGDDLSKLPLEKLVDLEAIIIDVSSYPTRAIGPEVLVGKEIRGRSVLFRTLWSRHWGTERYLSSHPFLTAEVARVLIDGGVALAGIDSLNIDDNSGRERPVHTLLLGRGIPIVEHLTNLDSLPSDGFVFSAVPVKVEGLGSFPVRAFAKVHQ